MWIKRILFALPGVVLLVFLVAFLVARENFHRRANYFIIGSIGDAERLNPVLATDTASGDVIGQVFNGLVKFDEDLNLTGDAASSWDVRQRSSFYPRLEFPGGAPAAAKLLDGALTTRARQEHGVTSIHADGERVVIEMDTAGTAFEDSILSVIAGNDLRPLNWITVRSDPDKTLVSGQPAGSKELAAAVREFAGEGHDRSWRLLQVRTPLSNRLEADVLGDVSGLLDFLNRRLLTDDEENSAGSLSHREGLFDNNPIITFHLRDGVRFHDGEPLTSADVRFTYDVLMDENTQTVRRSDFEPVQSLETPDPLTVRVTYKRPFVPCLEAWSMGILPRHLLEGKDINKAELNRAPVGSGPFRFEEWRTAEKISVGRNDDYFEGRPFLDGVTFRIIPDMATLELAFLVGGTDLYGIQPHQFDRYEDEERFDVYSRLSNAYTYVGWNMRKPMFADLKTRRALTLAIDREKIVKYVLFGHGRVGTGPFTPEMWYYNHDVAPLSFDTERARELLAEAGWADTDGDGVLDRDGEPFVFELATNNGNALRKDTSVLIRGQLEELGIQAQLRFYEWATFIKKVDERSFDAVVLGWSLSLDPDQYQLWHSSEAPSGLNFCGYVSPEVDRLLEEGRSEYDRERRKQIYFRIHEIIAGDLPYTFLYVPESLMALRSGQFKIAERTAAGGVATRDVSMTKAGILYHLRNWTRTSALSQLEP